MSSSAELMGAAVGGNDSLVTCCFACRPSTVLHQLHATPQMYVQSLGSDNASLATDCELHSHNFVDSVVGEDCTLADDLAEEGDVANIAMNDVLADDLAEEGDVHIAMNDVIVDDLAVAGCLVLPQPSMMPSPVVKQKVSIEIVSKKGKGLGKSQGILRSGEVVAMEKQYVVLRGKCG